MIGFVLDYQLIRLETKTDYCQPWFQVIGATETFLSGL